MQRFFAVWIQLETGFACCISALGCLSALRFDRSIDCYDDDDNVTTLPYLLCLFELLLLTWLMTLALRLRSPSLLVVVGAALALAGEEAPSSSS